MNINGKNGKVPQTPPNIPSTISDLNQGLEFTSISLIGYDIYVSIKVPKPSCKGPPTQSNVNLNNSNSAPIKIGYAKIGFKTILSILSLIDIFLSELIFVHLDNISSNFLYV